MAYPEQLHNHYETARELPLYNPVEATLIYVKNADGNMGFVSASTFRQELDAAGLATDADIAALQSQITSGSFDKVYATNNGNGTNFAVGDDAWIGDINVANTMQVSGVEDPTKGYVRFGSGSSSPSFGYGGTNDHVDLSCALKLQAFPTLPTATVGTLAVSGSHLYFHNGSGWNQVV